MQKILIVGASKGIGASLLEKLIQNHEVVNFSRTEPLLQHFNLTHHPIDVINDELPDLEGISNIVYCPGSINLKPISSLKIEDFRNDFEINVLGAVKVVKKYLRSLKKDKNASIVLFSTVAAAQGMPFHSSIASSKAALEGLAKSLAAELAPNVRVNCIAPSVTNTPLASGILRNEKAIENIQNRHPLKRILDVDDISYMAEYLLSIKSKGITGQVIGIDAGLSTLKL